MAFDLGEMLKGVSELDTGREQIEYISLDLIDEDPGNFYQLTDIPLLADNISLCGLQQPIRVRQKADDAGRYVIVSGHRRRAALEMLVSDGYDKWKEAPCIVEQDAVSPALQQLRLIYANSSTRKMTPAEISEQAVQVEKLLYQLKEEGYDFPGRMRDHVAEAVGASKTKLARLKVIRDKLAFCWKQSWNDGKLGESTAYALAQMPASWQQLIFDGGAGKNPNQLYEGTVKEYFDRFEAISKTTCGINGDVVCSHKLEMMQKSCKDRWSDPCISRCCLTCISLRTCKSACYRAESKKRELKESHKAAISEEARRAEERDRPQIEIIRQVYSRVGAARLAAGVSVSELYKASGRIFGTSDTEKECRLEDGSAKVSTNTNLPFGYSFFASDVKGLVAVADLLNVSIDYLLGRTDIPEMVGHETPVSNSDTWRTGNPTAPGDYILMLQPHGCSVQFELWHWEDDGWEDDIGKYDPNIDGRILGWIPMPGESKSPLNNSCKTGMSPSGRCGAAAVCEEPVDCCLNCGKDCNLRCGWPEAE